jgi:hypothetical protein
MTSTAPDNERIRQIFFPYADSKAREALAANSCFVYYTTAETAIKILKTKQIWLRNTLAMNDYMEFDHGYGCFKAAYQKKPGKALDAALNKCFAGLADEARGHFDEWLPTIEHDTYMMCLSEHLASEDAHGRLSMWRAYGGPSGIALVLNSAALSIESDALGMFASPVAYLDADGFAAQVMTVARNVEREIDFVRTLQRDMIRQVLFNAFRFSVLCTKHPGFHEEREWRVIASPTMNPSPFLVDGIEVVRGAAQNVLKVDLQNHLEAGVRGLTIPELLDRVIIGPCEYPVVTLKAFRRLLSDAGISEPNTRVTVSGIPLRHS